MRSVLVVRPPDSVGTVDHPNSQLMLGPVDLNLMRDQADAVVDTFRGLGVEVYVARPPGNAPPNIVFARDLFFMTPAGAVVARMASAQRCGEERHMARSLAECGVPIVCTVTGTATFEAADALWLDSETVAVGTGFRTNRGGAEVVRRVLAEQGANAVSVPLASGVQHLLGAVVPVDRRVAVACSAALTEQLRRLLSERDYNLIELEDNDELPLGRAMNFVTVAPGRVVMPASNPVTRRRLERAGIEVHEVEISQYLMAAGGIGCITGILRRSW